MTAGTMNGGSSTRQKPAFSVFNPMFQGVPGDDAHDDDEESELEERTTQERYELTDKSMNVMSAKSRMCKVIGTMNDVRLDYRISRLLDIMVKQPTNLFRMYEGGDEPFDDHMRNFADEVQGGISIDPTAMLKGLGAGLQAAGSMAKDVGKGAMNGDVSKIAALASGALAEGIESTTKDGEEGLCMSKAGILLFEQLFSQMTEELCPDHISEAPMVTVMLDLMMYEDHKLFEASFRTLVRHFTQRRALVNQLGNVQLLVDETTVSAYKILEQELSILRNHVESYEMWGISNDFSDDGSVNTTIVEKVKDTLVKIINMCQDGERKQDSRNMSLAESAAGSNSKPHAENQELLTRMNVHTIIIRAMGIAFAEGELEGHTGHLFDIKKLCCQFLEKFVHEHSGNQSLIFEEIGMLLSYMGMGLDSGRVITSMFHDNQPLCAKIDERVIVAFANTIDMLGVHMGTKYITFFEEIIAPGGQEIKRNQELVLKVICDSHYEVRAMGQVCLLFMDGAKDVDTPHTSSVGFKKRQQLCASFDPELIDADGGDGSQASIDTNTLVYHCSVMRLLAVVCKGKTASPELKCQQMFRWEQLIDVLMDDASNDMVKGAFCKFLTEVYFETEITEYDELAKEARVHELLTMLTNDIHDFMEEATRAAHNNNDSTDPTVSASRALLAEYIFEGAIPTLGAFCKNFYRPEEADDEMDGIFNAMRDAVKQFIRSGVYDVAQRAALIKCGVDMKMYHYTAAERLEMSSKEQEEKVARSARPSIYGGTDPRVVLTKLSKAINNSKEVHHRMAGEFAQMVFIFEQVESRTDPHDDSNDPDDKHDKRTNVITPEMLVRRIVSHISSPEGMESDVDLNIDALQLLQKTLEDKEEWEEEYVESHRISEDDVKEREEAYEAWQNSLNDWGVSGMLIDIISKSRSDKLIIATMELANQLLNNGNLQVQTTLYELLVGQKNAAFFKQMHERMRRGGMALKNKRKKRKYNKSKNLEEGLDDEEEFDPVRMELVGRMLQLFAEGHNLLMQNLIRDQAVLGFRSSHNLLDEAVNLLSTAAKDEATIKTMNDGDAEDLGMVLDFVIEVVQGPCERNQELLASSQLVDVCKRLITADFERNMEIKPDTVKEVKGNAVKALAALLEGRADKAVHTLLVQTINPKIIRRRMVDVFQQYEEQKDEHFDEPDWDEAFLDEGFDLLTMANALSATDGDFSESMSFRIDTLLAESFYKDKREFFLQKSKIKEQKEFAKAHRFLDDRVKSIEISWNGNLDRIYFPVPSECAFMTDSAVEAIKSRIDYTSDDKKQNFVKEAEALYDQLQHYEKLHEFAGYRMLAGKRLGWLKGGSYYLALLMNFIMLISLEKNYDAGPKYEPYYMEHIQLALGLVQVCTSSLVLFFLLSERAPLVYKKMERNMKVLKIESLDFNLEDLSANLVGAYNAFFSAFSTAILGTSAILAVFVLMYFRWPTMDFHVFWAIAVAFEVLWCTKGLRKYIDQPLEPISFMFCCGYDILTTGDTLFYVLYVLCAYIGVIYNPILYCFHLLDLVVMSASLQHVVKV